MVAGGSDIFGRRFRALLRPSYKHRISRRYALPPLPSTIAKGAKIRPQVADLT